MYNVMYNRKQQQVCQYSHVLFQCCSYMYTDDSIGLNAKVYCVHTHSDYLGMHPVHKAARDATAYY